ncbi:facilitated trehalose transporter Tret1-like [Vanessa cardui]|uniref:facilitated trehalose transporter Tret1-like n=1 Tax=Vanessa cardui TaxID=171605 RepID=UPI001F1382DF|nr:facilitated trehalose transporter Tret1-like [Vanessa cardui]
MSIEMPAAVNIGQFIDGYSVGWSAPIIPKLQDPNETPLPALITDLEASWIGSLLYVGAIVGPYIPSYLSNIIGRKPCLFLGSFLNLTAIVLIIFTKNVAMIFAIRIISGLESPVYYAIKAKQIETKNTLRYLGRVDDLENVFECVKGTSPDEGHSWKAWMNIFTVKANRKSLFITLSLCTLQQTSGVAAVLFFATNIFKIAGSSIRPDIATIIIGATRLLASLVAPFVVERAGRRILLLVSTAFCAISLSILGTYFHLSRIQSAVIADIGWLPLLALIMYFFSYEIGFGTMPSALVGEMFSGNARSTGSAVSMTTAWLIGFGIATGFGSMVKVLGGDVTFWIFSGSCIVAFLFTYKFVPETKGQTLNEIQKLLGRSNSL